MKLAACIWEVENAEEAAMELAEGGFAYVELGPSVFMKREAADVEKLGADFTRGGVTIWSGHAPFGRDCNISSPDDSLRKKAVEDHIKMLHKAASLHVHHVVVHPGMACAPEELPRGEDNIRTSLEKLLPLAEKLGVKMAVENLPPKHVGWDCGKLAAMVRQFDSKWMGTCFDTGHAHMMPKIGVMEAFKALGDTIIAFHAQDNDGTWDRHIQPPYGTTDWRAFATHLKSVNFTDPIAIEAKPWTDAGWKCEFREIQALFALGQVFVNHEGREAGVVCSTCGHYFFDDGERFCACS